jgi:leucyl aminopeptidase
MKVLTTLALGAATIETCLAAAVIAQKQTPMIRPEIPHTSHTTSEKFLIELAPYETLWVTEEEKWDLKLVRLN